jgi:type VI secretion system secreted protein Hcp
MAVDMFLKLDGISGESADSKHKGEIDIESFSFGVSQPGTSSTGGGGGSGKASFSDLSIVKKADKSSPNLMLKCATGEHIASALLTVRKAGGSQQEYYKIKLTDLLVSNFQNTGSGGDSIPVESLSLNFAKIEFEYNEQDSKGGLKGVVKSGYDIKGNKKV